jgi:Protein of unknown function (DUF3168)
MVDIADATIPLQQAIIALLRNHAPLVAIVGKRTYDQVDPSAEKPYVSIGPIQVIPEKAIGYDASDISLQIDGWSAQRSSMEIKQIGAVIRAALDQAALTLQDHRLVDLTAESTGYLLDPDGLTRHAVLTFRARTEPV